jgi:hypothetical protein
MGHRADRSMPSAQVLSDLRRAPATPGYREHPPQPQLTDAERGNPMGSGLGPEGQP